MTLSDIEFCILITVAITLIVISLFIIKLQWKNNMNQNNLRKVPWTDFDNNELYEGDKIKHPDGAIGIIVYMPKFTTLDDQWRVNYIDTPGVPARLCLQIGDRGRAIKVFK